MGRNICHPLLRKGGSDDVAPQIFSPRRRLYEPEARPFLIVRPNRIPAINVEAAVMLSEA
jgi:hypothetical protein